MADPASFPLLCPLDRSPLTANEQSLVCDQGHCFDTARQGYLHLLPVQFKKSKAPGDNKAMVQARRRFLESGAYAPIAEALQSWLWNHAAAEQLNCLDAGCGEGYYLRYLQQRVPAAHKLRAMGLDISKEAILAAAKKDKASLYLVATNAHIPVASASMDTLFCMFGFPVASEFHRLLKPQGELFIVDAGPDHLLELRDILYTERKVRAPSEPPQLAGFQLMEQQTIRFSLPLTTAEAIGDLLAMTPHFYRAEPAGRARVSALTSLTVTVEVCCSRWQKQS